MLGMNWCRKSLRQLLALWLVVVLGWSLAGCNQPLAGSGAATTPKASRSQLTEVSPPLAIQTLKQSLEVYQPQVKILSPRPNQTIEDTQVEVRLQVQDLPLFKDEVLELGPYLQVLLDNQPYAQVHDLSQPLSIDHLAPGTHTIRAFAVRPWHESFKNEAAFAQTTFHVFTQTADNTPSNDRPLLTYNYPQGTYGAEPVLLDFYLTNAPLHLVAREDAEDEIPDWQIRCTVNGESFSFDRWEPIYLKGLKPGRNWVQLELLDDQGQPIANAFNNSVQLVTYEPGGSDTLAQLSRGELTAEAARKIVDPNYVPPPEPVEPEPEAEPEAGPEPEAEPEPTIEPIPAAEKEPAPEVNTETDAESAESQPADSESEVILEPDLTQEPVPETMPPELVAPATEPNVNETIVQPEAIESQSESESEVQPIDPTKPELVEPEPANAEPDKPELLLPAASESGLVEEKAPEKLLTLPVSPTDALNQPAMQPAPTGLELQKQLESLQPLDKLAPPALEPAAFPRQTFQQPDRTPDLPASPATAAVESPISSQTETDRSREESLSALEDKLEKVFQAPMPDQSESLPQFNPSLTPETQAIQTSPIQSVASPDPQPIETRETIPLSALEQGLPVEEIPDAVPEATPDLTKPDLVGVFDRVKDFFEGLRKQPGKINLPFLSPLDGKATETDAASADGLEQIIEKLLVEPAESEPSANPANPN